MTTIAYRDGVMAADSQGTSGDVAACTRIKMFEAHGWLIGGAGNSTCLEEFQSWFIQERADGKLGPCPPSLQTKDGAWNVLCVSIEQPTVVYQLEDGRWPYRIFGKYHAIGSGYAIALGAMAAGATAEQAVKAAIKHDIYSGGPVRLKKCFPEKIVINSLKVR